MVSNKTKPKHVSKHKDKLQWNLQHNIYDGLYHQCIILCNYGG